MGVRVIVVPRDWFFWEFNSSNRIEKKEGALALESREGDGYRDWWIRSGESDKRFNANWVPSIKSTIARFGFD